MFQDSRTWRFSRITDAWVLSKGDEVALYADVASDAFKTDKLSHK